MTTEVLPETRPTPPQSPASEPTQHETPSPTTKTRWIRGGMVVVGLMAILATAAALIPSTMSAKDENDSTLLHTVVRTNLTVTVTEQGTLESSNNTEIKCKVRGFSTVTWVIPGGSEVEPGDELVRLDTKVIEEQVSLTKTDTHIATATLERSKANVAQATISIEAYEKGGFRAALQDKELTLHAKERNLRVARKMLDRSKALFKQGYVTDLEVAGNEFTVTQAELELKVVETEIDVLKRLTKKKQMVTFTGNLTASKSKQSADEAGLAMEQKRKLRAQEELEACVIKADRPGLVIYPSAAAWKRTPDITEGATVRKDQVLLLMPDLTQMQVKVGIHESIVDRVKPGLRARVTLPDRTLEAEVSTVAAVTKPAGWWTGNVVKYDTIIELPSVEGLKPGMSAEVEVILAEHKDVLTVPVAAIVETEDGDYCWVKSSERIQRRTLQLGDSNDVFVIVESGLKEGDQVILNPVAFLEEAEKEALKTIDESKPRKGSKESDSDQESQSQDSGT